MTPTSITFKETFLSRKKTITLYKDYFEIDDSELIDNDNTIVSWDNITGLKTGVKPIKGIDFNIGRVYIIFIKRNDQKVVKIKIKSIYGIHKRKAYEKYCIILNQLFELYLNRLLNFWLEKLIHNEKVTIEDIEISKDYIRQKKVEIPISELDHKLFSYYYSIYSINYPEKQIHIDFLNDWNALLIYELVNKLKER